MILYAYAGAEAMMNEAQVRITGCSEIQCPGLESLTAS
jgi:hypothetical protein